MKRLLKKGIVPVLLGAIMALSLLSCDKRNGNKNVETIYISSRGSSDTENGSSSTGAIATGTSSDGSTSAATASSVVGTPGTVTVPGGTASDGSTIERLIVSDCEVTQGQYETYCCYGGNGCCGPDDVLGRGPNYPVYYVNWSDAIVYCNLRSMVEGLTPCYSIEDSTNPADWSHVKVSDGKYCGPAGEWDAWNEAEWDSSANGWRLPTQVEWEWLANGGRSTAPYTYAGSNNINEVAWYYDNSYNISGQYIAVHEVKTKTPNSLGLYDMSGSMSEWCWDRSKGVGVWYVRTSAGGSCKDDSVNCTVSSRYNSVFGDRKPGLGFRVVRNANGSAKTSTAPKQSVDAIAGLDLPSKKIFPYKYVDMAPEEPELSEWLSNDPVYVIGWSKDGKVALCMTGGDGDMSASVTFLIHDMVSDEVVWKLEENDNDVIGGDGPLVWKTVTADGKEHSERIWNLEKPEEMMMSNSSLIDGALKKYGIQFVDVPYQKLPAKSDKTSVSFSVDIMDGYKDSDEWEMITKYSIVAQKEGGKKKTVTTVNEAHAEHVVPLGYMKSPFEERILLFWGTDYRFEGHNVDFHIAGCHLGIGL